MTPTNRPAREDSRGEGGVSIGGAPLGSLLLQVIRCHRHLGEQLLGQIGLVPPQEIVLMYLDEHGAVPQSDVVRYLGRDRSTVTATLQALERLGLIVREPSSVDRRAITVALSDPGSALTERARSSWARLERAGFGGLSAAEQRQLARALAKVRDSLAEELADEMG